MSKQKIIAVSVNKTTSAEFAFTPKWWWMLLALALVTFTLGYPVFSGGFLVNPHSDQYIAGYGFREFAAQSLRSGHGFPQWSPALFGGLPYVAAMHGDIFYPTFLLRMIMRTDLAMTWGFIIHLFLAGAFTLGFLRAWGLTVWPASFGALAYMMSGTVASYASAGHDGKLFVSALLPLALWMLTRAIRDDRPWAWGVFAFTVGLAVLSPHPQLLQYFLFASGAFTLFLVLRAHNDASDVVTSPHAEVSAVTTAVPAAVTTSVPTAVPAATADRRFIVTRLAAALGAVVIGLCIGAIQYWPVLGYVNSSPRANGREYEFATQYSFPPEELFNTYLPQFTGMLGSYWGRNVIHLHSEYMGVVVLLLAPLAFGTGSRKGFARFFLATALVALLWALGGYTPLYKLIYWIPGTKYFRAPSTIIYLFTFAVSVLSALGVERLLKQLPDRNFLTRYVGAWCAFGILVALLGVTGTLNNFAALVSPPAFVKAGYNPVGYTDLVQQNAPALLRGAFRSLAFLSIASALLLAYSRRKISLTVFAGALLATSAVDLWSIDHLYWIFSRPATELYAGDAIIDYLKSQKEPGRVFVYTRTADYRTTADPYFGTNGFGSGTGFMVHGIRSVTGYQGNVLARYQEIADGKFLVTPPFWRHENVRYLYTNTPVADTVLTQVAGPVDNAAGSRAYLYRMPGDNPYAWVAATIASVNDTVAGRAILTGNIDPKVLASFDPASGIGGKVPDSLPAPSAIVAQTKTFSAGHATIQLSQPATPGSALIISENYYPGWTALVDGKTATLARAEYNLIGIPLPTGAKSVVISFKDPRYDTGKFITWIALALTALLIMLGARAQDGEVTNLQAPARVAGASKMTAGDAA